MNIEQQSKQFYRFSIFWGVVSSLLVLFFIKSGIKSQFVFSIKDLVIYLYAFFFIGTWLNTNRHLHNCIILLFFIGFLFANYFLLNINYNAPFHNIRQIIAPVILLIIYTNIRLTKESVEKISKYICYLGILVFFFGIFEQTFQLWQKINLSDFFLLKHIPVDEKGLSYMFYEPTFGNRERMTSILLDPISLGHFYATLGGYLFYMKNKNKIQKTTFYLCVISLFLCLSKGAILQFYIYIFVFNKNINIFIRLIATLFFLFICVGLIVIYNVPIANFIIHITGFVNSIQSITFFGHGIGTAGNYASMFSNSSLELHIGDSYMGTLIGQIGIFGTLSWLTLICLVIYTSISNKVSKRFALRMFFSIFLVSVLSENTMNVTSFLLPSILIGLCVNTSKQDFK
jgi:hypothetical protein